MADMNSESRNSTETLSRMTMEVYGQEAPSTAAYSRQQAYDSNLQQIQKKRDMRRQLEDKEALLLQANRIPFWQNDV